MRSKTAIGYLCSILGGICWALSGVCGQYIFMNKGFTSDWLVPIRLLAAGTALTLFLVIRDREKALAIWRDPADRRDLIIFGLLGLALCQYSYFTSILYSNAATATVLCYLDPVLVMLWVSFRQKRRPTPGECVSVVLVVIGTFICATHGHMGSLAISAKALVWGLVSAAAFALYSVQPRGLMARHGTPVPIGWGMMIGGAVLMLICRPWHQSGAFDGGTLAAMIVICLFGTILSFCLYSEGIRRIGATKGSILAAVEPVASTVLSVVWLKVVFQPVDLLGFACIVSTIFILALSKGKSA